MKEVREFARSFHGSKLYQKRARLILPVLIRQADAEEPISYKALALEIGMPNPRNLNYPLGCVGTVLNNLADYWGETIPPIQSLVVNQQTGFPGRGFDELMKAEEYNWNTTQERKAVIREYWARVHAYPYWDDVLEELNLSRFSNNLSDVIKLAGLRGGYGEGPEHQALKKRISENPDLVGLKAQDPEGQLEFGLPSGDRVDIVFCQRHRIHAIEVKPAKAAIGDVARGLFQCVKYRSVFRALLAWKNDRRQLSVGLALGGQLPERLVPLQNALNIQVYESLEVD